MKFLLATFLFALVCNSTLAQNKTFYVAYSSGVNMRESGSLTAKLIGKIPYATKLQVDVMQIKGKEEIVENMRGSWTQVTYQGKKGYVLDCYLTSWAPPKKGTKTIADYLMQITKKFGNQLVVKTPNTDTVTMDGSTIKKQLYANGAARHESEAHEYYGDTYFFPGISMQEAFVLLRQLTGNDIPFTEKEEYFTESKKIKKKIGEHEVELDIKVDVDKNGDYKYIKKISIDYDQGAYTHFEMFEIEGHIVISISSGV